jgi:hypothetical protein
MSALHILIADDHGVLRGGLCDLLETHSEWEVCAEAALEHNRSLFTSRVAEMILHPSRNPSVEQAPSLSVVSSRERTIVQLLQTHRANIMPKLGPHSRSELVLYARRNHIVPVQVGPK